MEEHRDKNHTLQNEDIFEDSFILIYTTKPIMAVKYDTSKDQYQVIYLTKDQKLKKSGKSLFVKEYIAGITSILKLKQLLSDNVSILTFFEDLYTKKRMVSANDKLFKPKEIASFDMCKENLPDNKYTLFNMPVNSRTSITKLKKLVDYDIEIKNDFNLKKSVFKDKFEINGNENCNKIIRDYNFIYTESEDVWNETDYDLFKKHTYDEIQSLSHYEV